MPIATPEIYNEMLDRAKKEGFAYPAINCTSSETINAALKGFAEAESDGIIQFSTGGASFGSGLAVQNKVKGALALAAFAHEAAENYGVNVALHTDHCQKEVLDEYVRPLIAISQERVDRGELPLFQSHMWDGSAIPIDENLVIAQELLEKAHKANIILEVEIGVVGGEEDGVEAKHGANLYTSPEDFEKTIDAIGHGDKGRYLLAATFGNVHGGEDRGGPRLRRHQDERRHRHPVRVYQPGRAPHVRQLRRRLQDRRRGRQQEGLRPAFLHEEGRAGHVRARHRGVSGPALGGHHPEQVSPAPSVS